MPVRAGRPPAVPEVWPGRPGRRALPASITTGTVTPTVTAGVTAWPLSLSVDRRTLYGVGTSAGVAYSRDDAQTWTYKSAGVLSAAGGVIGVREMANGELLVMSSYTGSTAGQIFVTSGWADDPSTATFTSTLEAEGGASARFTNAWSVDTYGSLVLAAEYGPKASDTDMARYLYLSTDYGLTWSTIFDLATESGQTVNAHLHGVAWDPFWDCIWLCSGDSTLASQTWVSFDLGDTWSTVASDHKCTTIAPMEDAVYFGTDDHTKNGVYKVLRSTGRTTPTMSLAYAIDQSTSLTVVGQQAWISRSAPEAPALLSFLSSDVVDGPGRLVAVDDDGNIDEVWTDTGQSYSTQGLYSLVGPTVSGKYFGHLSRAGGDHRLLTLEVT